MHLDFSANRFELVSFENAVSDTIVIFNKLTAKQTVLELSHEGIFVEEHDDIDMESFDEKELNDLSDLTQVTPKQFRDNPLLLAGKRVLVKYDDNFYAYDVHLGGKRRLELQSVFEGNYRYLGKTLSFDPLLNNGWRIVDTVKAESVEVTIHLIQ
jgi:hypothetical protein